MEKYFKEKNVNKLLLQFSTPCIISLLINSIYNIVDQIFIGQGVSYLGNAATNIIFPLTIIFSSLAILIGDGSAAFLSLNIGEGDYEEAKKGVGCSITFLIVVSVILAFISYINLDSLLNIFGCTKNIYGYAMEYGQVIIIGLPFMVLTIALSGMIRGDGNPKYAMIATVSGAILNIILDYLFVFIFDLGMFGAALATVIGQFVSFIIAIAYLRKFRSFKLVFEDFKLNSKIFKVMKYGLSGLISQINFVFVMLVMNNCLSIYGAQSVYGSDIPLSVFGVVMKTNQIIISIIIGIALGSQPILGYGYGAKQFDMIKKIMMASIKWAVIVGCIGITMYLVFPTNLLSLYGKYTFLGKEFGTMCFRIFLLMLPLNAFQMTAGIILQSLGKTKQAIIISISRQILLFIPICLIFSKFFGIMGTLVSAPIADFIAFIIAYIIFKKEYKNIINTRENVNL